MLGWNGATRTIILIGGLVVCAAVTALAPGPADAQSESDVMVLRNGDLNAGAVARESFSIRTGYGTIDIPYGQMANLFFGKTKNHADRLYTVGGERFTGKLIHQSLFVLRGVFGVSLDVDTRDIARIEFARPKIRRLPAPATDVVVLRNGDRLRAAILTAPFLLRTEGGLGMVQHSGTGFLDLDRDEDGQTVAEARDRLGKSLNRGILMNTAVTIRTHHGQELTLPPAQIVAIAFGVYKSGGKSASTDAGRAARPGSPSPLEFRDPFPDGTLGPRLVPLKPGAFRRGDLTGGGDADEQPVQAVTIAKPFAIGAFPVTFAEYDRFADEFGRPRPDDQDWGRGTRPVVNVTWKDAVTYTQWLSKQTGQRYRLPTDAEWEYAARAGSKTRYWWGNDPGSGRANCSTCGSLWDAERTAPVGRFPPNPLGLYDITGNVFQWTADCYHNTLSGYPADGSALDKPGCGKRIIRGGAWSFPPKEMRSANRWRDFPSRSSDDTGFRIVREME